MNNIRMKFQPAIVVLVIVFAVLFSRLPVYPLLVEGREISQTGESLYQEWRFVSLAEYNDSKIFAYSAWQDSIWVICIILGVVNYLALFTLSWFCAMLVLKIIRKAKHRLL